jgi:Ni,Fe-hydrogenase I large subunit
MEGAQFIHDHIIHFYHLHALDWVDVVSALSADPNAASALQKSMSDWANNSPTYFSSIKAQLQKLVSSTQLGLFANGYWGHPGYKLPPEANLVLVAHYLEALNFQRDFIKIHAMMGGKNPHPQTYAVGGMAIPLDKTSSAALNPTKIATIKGLVQTALNFTTKVYVPDVMLIAKYYPEYGSLGGGVRNYLSYGDLPGGDPAYPSAQAFAPGTVVNRNLGAAPAAINDTLIKEYVAHSWYSYTSGDSTGLHPKQGQTTPKYTGPSAPYDFLNTSYKYSWLKAPRYNNLPMEVGPLARTLVSYAAGRSRIRQLVDNLIFKLGQGQLVLFSTLGRVAARAIETQYVAELMGGWLDSLAKNINAGNVVCCNTSKWSPTTWPVTAAGLGRTEAPRGALAHWFTLGSGKINTYQAIVATTWNGSPRDATGNRGPFEQALVGLPVVDTTRPLEVLRVIHSFDPCMACAVHVYDTTGKPLVEISNTRTRN